MGAVFDRKHGGIILCALRSMNSEHCTKMANLGTKYFGKGVVGLDVAGDEGSFPLNSKYQEIKKGTTEN